LENTLISNSERETIKAGFDFAGTIKVNDIIGLDGELGTGKTQFVKGICDYFQVSETVNSPTFIIVNEYIGEYLPDGKKLRIYHFDLYRLEHPSELEIIGFDEYLNHPQSIILIEWPLLAEEYLGKKIQKIAFDYGEDENSRVINL
jgi:tRNA threonylcarbamoyladenosine biosynthesis protein TsaE